MNICGKRKYINPYSRGAVLCKLAERQMKGMFMNALAGLFN